MANKILVFVSLVQVGVILSSVLTGDYATALVAAGALTACTVAIG